MLSERVCLYPDYAGGPLWLEPSGLGIDLEEVPLSSRTRADLRAWSTSYESLIDDNYEPTATGELAFEREGRRLWRLALAELASKGWVVGYFSEVEQRKFWDPAELPSLPTPPRAPEG